MLSSELAHQIADELKGLAISESLLTDLRARYPAIHFTYCMDDDIPNHEPVINGEAFNIYLVDGREHCMCLTTSFENASGLVIAEVIAE